MKHHFLDPLPRNLDCGKTRSRHQAICPSTGRKFYDLNKNPVISSLYRQGCHRCAGGRRARDLKPEAAARPRASAGGESIVPETADAELVSLEDAEAEAAGQEAGGRR